MGKKNGVVQQSKKAGKGAAAQNAPAAVSQIQKVVPKPLSGIAPTPPAGGDAMRGPTPYSNWVIKPWLMMGAAPVKEYMIDALVDIGITAFVSLLQPHEWPAQAPPYSQRATQRATERDSGVSGDHGKHKCNPGKTGADSGYSGSGGYGGSAGGCNGDGGKVKSTIFHTLCIPDRDVIDDDEISHLVDSVLGWMRTGRLVYVHCYGGHGRSGTVCSLLISKACGIPPEEALDLNQALHDCRPDVDGIKASSVPSPQTAKQRSQVKRIAQRWA